MGGNRPATGLRRRKEEGGRRGEEGEAPPGVLCNQHLENSWKEEECVCVRVVHMCFLTFGYI